MINNNNKNKVVIPIQNTSINDLNNTIHEPEKEHKQIWSFLCVISTMIASVFCCITSL